MKSSIMVIRVFLFSPLGCKRVHPPSVYYLHMRNNTVDSIYSDDLNLSISKITIENNDSLHPYLEIINKEDYLAGANRLNIARPSFDIFRVIGNNQNLQHKDKLRILIWVKTKISGTIDSFYYSTYYQYQKDTLIELHAQRRLFP